MVEGLIVMPSAHDPGETMRRLIAHIDHAAAATKAGLALAPTDLLIFGAAKGGTPLMQAQQSMGIDLPLKALVWQEEDGRTLLGYNDPAWLAKRHGVENDKVIAAMRDVLAAVAAKAIS
jgi:uncharacterized protein (DUF302 family)